MRQRWIAIMLCISMLCSMVVHAVPAVHATEKSVYILHEGEQIDQLTIQQHEKETLAAWTQGIDVLEYQWQLLLDAQSSIWVNIYDATEPECTVSYAVVKNLLDDSNSTSIRCAVTSGEARYYSDPVDIEITFIEDTAGEMADVPKVLVSDLVVLDPETGEVIGGSSGSSSIPVATPSIATPSGADKESGAATEETTGAVEETSAADEETTGAAEETSASIVETTGAVEETTATSEEETQEPTEESDDCSEVLVRSIDGIEYENMEESSENQEEAAADASLVSILTSFFARRTRSTKASLASGTRILKMSQATPAEADRKTTEAETTPAETGAVSSSDATPSVADKGNDGPSSSDGMMLLSSPKAASEYVTITIKYLDESSLTGAEAAIYSPYVATIVKGTDFAQNVVSPTFLGFAPFYDSSPGDDDTAVDDDASKIELNLANVTEDIEIKVYYMPIEVTFAVRYFFQNINDDLYTEDVSLYRTDKEKTGTKIENQYFLDHAGDTTGFEKMYHIPEAIAADGSTVFECYYDRNYYLQQFNLDGGYGVEPIYGRYDAPFIVNDPIRHGYTFKGWDLIEVDSDDDGVADTGNGLADELPSTIPAQNQSYIALWETVDTTYTIVYWLDNGDGTYSFIGNRRENAKSSSIVSGKDDLATSNVCGTEVHTHSVANGCYSCGQDHECTIDCYATSGYKVVDTLNESEKRAYNSFINVVGSDAKELYVYKYCYRWSYYNFFYCQNTWYYLGTNNSYCGIRLSGTLPRPNNNSYSYIAAVACANMHIHGDECLICTKEEHTHTNACKVDTSKYTFVRADQNKLVEGDGSTTVNVYYTCKSYTLRFYYAKSVNGVPYVVGGSTYPFGAHNQFTDENTTVRQLLENVTAWGKVKSIPVVTEQYRKNYTIDDVTYGNTTYYYLEFTAKYGSDIGDLWPVGIFDPVLIDEVHDQCDYEYAYFSAWNGEYKVKYTQEHRDNETIKGCYMYLDDNLLFDSRFEDGSLVSFLGFWENGANVEWSVPKLYEYQLWVESLDDPNKYELYKTFNVYDDSGFNNQTITTISGLEYQTYKTETVSDGSDGSMEHYIIKFYYGRQDYELMFYNYSEEVSTKTVAYGDALSEYDFVPAYPSTLEENAYEFAGWYTTAECYAESKVDMNTDTMPAYDMILYAKWAPEVHTVNFFKTLNDMKQYEQDSSSITPYRTYDTIIHGNIVGDVTKPDVENMSGMSLIFAGWFYLENGQKKAFSPLNMPINRDMNIFADWSTNSPQPYRIQYKLLPDNAGNTAKAADDTIGFAYGGSTRTFIAKAGDPYNQLYAEYNSGYFPTVGSHSITMQYEGDYSGTDVVDYDTLKHNVYTFYYVQASDVKYTVRYVNKATNTLLEQETVKTTSNAVVTERFKPFENMVPDSFYKSLVISVEKDGDEWVGSEDNVITFYYMPNSSSAYYAVHYMLEKLDATEDQKSQYWIDGSGGYEETGTHIEGVGDIGSTISVTPKTFEGFGLLDKGKETRSAADKDGSAIALSTGGKYEIEITKEGTELYIFYERLDYDYVVYYYEYNTTNSLLSPKYVENVPYESIQREEMVDISGYWCVTPPDIIDGAKKIKTITIGAEEFKDETKNPADLTQNVLILYYAPLQYTAEYLVVDVIGDQVQTPEKSHGGWLSNTIEVITGGDIFVGSIPTANTYYEFGGWYLDECLTQPLADEEKGSINPDTGMFVPDKDKLSVSERNIFYAKFVLKAADLTIERTNADSDGQVFVYEVKNTSTGESVYVTIKGNDRVVIHDLPLGTYTVTQQNDWSWRYSDVAYTKVDHTSKEDLVSFKESGTQKWLNGNSEVKVNRRGMSE